MPLTLISTADIRQDVKEELVREWSAVGGLEIGFPVYQKSAEPPSWIHLVGNAEDWAKALRVVVELYFLEMLKENAKDVYKSRTHLVRALAHAGSAGLRRAIAAMLRARLSSPTHPGLVLGLSVPSDYFCTGLRLTDEPEEVCAYKAARFVQHAQQIQDRIQAEIDAGRAPLAGVIVDVGDDALILTWLDRQFNEYRVELPFAEPDAAQEER